MNRNHTEKISHFFTEQAVIPIPTFNKNAAITKFSIVTCAKMVRPAKDKISRGERKESEQKSLTISCVTLATALCALPLSDEYPIAIIERMTSVQSGIPICVTSFHCFEFTPFPTVPVPFFSLSLATFTLARLLALLVSDIENVPSTVHLFRLDLQKGLSVVECIGFCNYMQNHKKRETYYDCTQRQ